MELIKWGAWGWVLVGGDGWTEEHFLTLRPGSFTSFRMTCWRGLGDGGRSLGCHKNIHWHLATGFLPPVGMTARLGFGCWFAESGWSEKHSLLLSHWILRWRSEWRIGTGFQPKKNSAVRFYRFAAQTAWKTANSILPSHHLAFYSLPISQPHTIRLSSAEHPLFLLAWL